MVKLARKEMREETDRILKSGFFDICMFTKTRKFFPEWKIGDSEFGKYNPLSVDMMVEGAKIKLGEYGDGKIAPQLVYTILKCVEKT